MRDDSATLPCPECGRPVYEDADRCPRCGESIVPGRRGTPSWIRWTAAALAAFIVASWILHC